MAIKKCPYCKSMIDEGDKFCSKCGTKLLFEEDEAIEEEVPGDRIIEEEEAQPKKRRASTKKSATAEKKTTARRKKAAGKKAASPRERAAAKKTSDSKEKKSTSAPKKTSRETSAITAEEDSSEHDALETPVPELPSEAPPKEHTKDFDPIEGIDELLKDKGLTDELSTKKEKMELSDEEMDDSVDFEKYIDVNEDVPVEEEPPFDRLINGEKEIEEEVIGEDLTPPPQIEEPLEEDALIGEESDMPDLESELIDEYEEPPLSTERDFVLAGDEEPEVPDEPLPMDSGWDMKPPAKDMADEDLSGDIEEDMEEALIPDMDEIENDEDDSIDFNTADLEKMVDPADQEKEEIERFLDSLKRERQEIQSGQYIEDGDLPPWAEEMKESIEEEAPPSQELEDHETPPFDAAPDLVGYDEPPPAPPPAAVPDDDMDLPESIDQPDLPFASEGGEKDESGIEEAAEGESRSDYEAGEEEVEASPDVEKADQGDQEAPFEQAAESPAPAFHVEEKRVVRPAGRPPATPYETWRHSTDEPSVFPKVKARVFDMFFIAVLWFVTLWIASIITSSPIFQLLSGSALPCVGLFFILLGLYFFFFFFFLGETLGNHLFGAD